MFLLLRKLWDRRTRHTEKESCQLCIISGPQDKSQTEPPMPDISFTTTPSNENQMSTNHLAILTTTAITTSTQKSTTSSELQTKSEPEEETFYHLRSLITASCFQSGHGATTSVSSLASKSGRDSMIYDKRASSIINLNILDLDLPSLPFPKPKKGRREKCKAPRYSPLPPPFVHKSLAMRPEVRF